MATKKSEKNEVEVREDMLPSVYDFGEDAGVGFEDTSQDDYSIPMLVLLQGLSPQVQEDGVEGAKPGMIMNSATKELYPSKDGVHFVPSHRTHVFIEWTPRDQGGGLVAIHDRDSQVVRDAKSRSKDYGKYYTPDGNELKETFLLYGIIVDDDGSPASGVVISFTATKIKSYRDAMSAMRSTQVPAPGGRRKNPPLFANQLVLRSKKKKNNKGDFFVFDVSFLRNNSAKDSLLNPANEKDRSLLTAAKDFAELVKSGVTKVDHSAAADAESEGFGDSDSDEDIPF